MRIKTAQGCAKCELIKYHWHYSCTGKWVTHISWVSDQKWREPPVLTEPLTNRNMGINVLLSHILLWSDTYILFHRQEVRRNEWSELADGGGGRSTATTVTSTAKIPGSKAVGDASVGAGGVKLAPPHTPFQNTNSYKLRCLWVIGNHSVARSKPVHQRLWGWETQQGSTLGSKTDPYYKSDHKHY